MAKHFPFYRVKRIKKFSHNGFATYRMTELVESRALVYMTDQQKEKYCHKEKQSMPKVG